MSRFVPPADALVPRRYCGVIHSAIIGAMSQPPSSERFKCTRPARSSLAGIVTAVMACSAPYVPPPIATVPGLAGTLIVPNKLQSTVTFVDVATGARLGTIPVGPNPHEIALSPDGTTAVTTAMDGHTLSVIDVAARQVVLTITLGADSLTHGIAYLPGDSIVAVTSRATRSAVFVNVLSGQVIGSVPTTGGHPHILNATADGSRIYTTEADSRTVSAFDANQRTLVRTFAIDDAPEGMAVTPDGAEVWAGTSTFLTGEIIVLEPSSGAVTTVSTMFGWPYRIHLTPDTRTVLIPDIRRGTLRFVDRASRQEVGRIRYGGGEPGGLAITPDGRYAFQTLMQQARVAIIDIAQRQVVGNLHVGDLPDGIVYTPRVFTSAP